MKHTAMVNLPARTSYKSSGTVYVAASVADVLVEIDLNVLTQLMAERAQSTKKGKSSLCDGLITCTLLTVVSAGAA